MEHTVFHSELGLHPSGMLLRYFWSQQLGTAGILRILCLCLYLKASHDLSMKPKFRELTHRWKSPSEEVNLFLF